MSYSYERERPRLFTESGIAMLFTIKAKCNSMIAQAGCVMASKAISDCTGDSFMMLACLDYLVETKHIKEVTQEYKVFGQDRVFIGGEQ